MLKGGEGDWSDISEEGAALIELTLGSRGRVGLRERRFQCVGIKTVVRLGGQASVCQIESNRHWEGLGSVT